MTAATGAGAGGPAGAPGEVVALTGPGGAAWVDAYRRLLSAGAVPLLVDPAAPADEHRRWLDRAGGGRILHTGAGEDGGATASTAATGDTAYTGAAAYPAYPGTGGTTEGGSATGVVGHAGAAGGLAHLGPATAAGPFGPGPTRAGGGGPHPPGTVLLPSSGTTGTPKLVARTVDSLRAEGRRHVRWARLTAADRVLLPLPLWHAYALGWLHAALEAGAAVSPHPPTALGAALREIERGATVLPLVPAVARLLSARAGRAPLTGSALRLAMVGAGAVDASLDASFRAAFGIGLARDYGSSETGSLFSAPAGAPPGRVGHPLDGVRFRILGDDGSPVPDDTAGDLRVSLAEDPDAGWRTTGDIAAYHPEHGLRILGRRGRAVRRGDRWVAPEEVETVLRAHQDVLDARVTGVEGRTAAGPTTRLHAEVVSLRGTGADSADLHTHAKDRLAAYKVPDRIRAVGELPRGRSGKPLPARRLIPGDEAVLIACAQAHKRSELLFALLRLGVVDLLRQGPADSARIASALGLDPDVCEQLLQVAESAGLLRAAPPDPDERPAVPVAAAHEDPPGPPADDGGPLAGTLAVLALEERLSRTWVTREQLTAVARTGPAGRAFDTEGPDDALREVYQRAMHTPAAHGRSRIGLRLAGPRPGRLLEITCGPGRYARAHGRPGDGRLLRVGTLAQQSAHSAAEPGGREEIPAPADGELFDLVVVCNAVHLPGPGSDLRALAARLAPGGRLLVDDVFLDAPGGLPQEIRLDWLTHGGSAWPTEATLTAGLGAAGFTVHRTVRLGKPAVTLIVAGYGADPGRPTGGAPTAPGPEETS
ncbi:AMP-binding protein [Streptomyces sp. NPDC014894]|uniref:AMP-binding protein n=1 Tax=Streptomyces sp. NPDC014894 TaxID=3364931 RepID=UPI0036F67144